MHQPSASHHLDRFDRDLMKFVVVWAPYGGPTDDELFPEFGISARQLRPRLQDIAVEYLSMPLNTNDRTLLLAALDILDAPPPRSDPLPERKPPHRNHWAPSVDVGRGLSSDPRKRHSSNTINGTESFRSPAR